MCLDFAPAPQLRDPQGRGARPRSPGPERPATQDRPQEKRAAGRRGKLGVRRRGSGGSEEEESGGSVGTSYSPEAGSWREKREAAKGPARPKPAAGAGVAGLTHRRASEQRHEGPARQACQPPEEGRGENGGHSGPRRR